MQHASLCAIFAAMTIVATTSASTAAPNEMSFCELSTNSEKYIGRLVSVSASYSPTLNETPALYNDNCPDGYILPLVTENDQSLKNLRDYRATGDALKGAFRIWGTFVGKLVKEKPLSDPYVQGDAGIHFQAVDVQNVRAISEP